jgi:MSHA biogenesis protein MshI
LLLFGRKNKKNKKNAKRVCVHLTDEGIAIVISTVTKGAFCVLSCRFFSKLDQAESAGILQDYIMTNKLNNATCSLILEPSEYQILLTESPNVDDSEMCQALWWKVKDLVAVDQDNAQIDYLDLPEDSNLHQTKKVYAIIADRQKTNKKIEFLEELGLRPIIVETPETALLHLTSTLCSSPAGTSVVYLNSEQSLLMLMADSQMYLSRTLQYDYQERPEAVVLDLQRSMDYYESQLGKPPCLKILVLPKQDQHNDVMQNLSNNINVDITTLDLNDVVPCAQELTAQLQQHCLIAICGALRSNVAISNTANSNTKEAG